MRAFSEGLAFAAKSDKMTQHGTNTATANLVRVWMTAEGTLAGDSVTAATAAAAKFTAELAARRL